MRIEDAIESAVSCVLVVQISADTPPAHVRIDTSEAQRLMPILTGEDWYLSEGGVLFVGPDQARLCRFSPNAQHADEYVPAPPPDYASPAP